MNSDYQYKITTNKDTDAIVYLLGEMMKALGQFDLYQDRKEYAEMLYNRDDRLPIVVYDDKTPVGFMVVEYYNDEKVAYIGDIVVAESYRNQGIGTHLIEIAEIYAYGMGAKKTRLSVYEGNTNAQRLYDRLGYMTYENAEAYIEKEKVITI